MASGLLTIGPQHASGRERERAPYELRQFKRSLQREDAWRRKRAVEEEAAEGDRTGTFWSRSRKRRADCTSREGDRDPTHFSGRSCRSKGVRNHGFQHPILRAIRPVFGNRFRGLSVCTDSLSTSRVLHRAS